MKDSLPDGAFACFDIFNGALVAVSESKNQVIKTINNDFSRVKAYGFPSSYNRQYYHWCKVNFVSENIIITLLKRHKDRSFHVASFLLDNDLEKCVLISHAKTYVNSFGLRVEAHRSGSQFVYVVCNSKKPTIDPKQLQGDNTRNFMKQLSQAIEEDNRALLSHSEIQVQEVPNQIHTCNTRSTELSEDMQPSTSRAHDSPGESEPLLSSEGTHNLHLTIGPESSQVSISRSNSRRDDERSISLASTTYQDFVESVILLVKCDARGTIFQNIVSTGRQRYGIKLRRAPSFRQLNKSFRTKVMTRWQSSNGEELCEPFLWGDQVIVIPRNDPTRLFATKTVTNVQSGVLASFLALFGRLCGTSSNTSNSSAMVTSPREERVLGPSPNPSHLWSNVDFCGDPRLLTLEPETGECLVYQLCRPTRLSYEWIERKVSVSKDVAGATKVAFRVDPKNHSNLLVRTSIRGEAADFNQFQIANEL